MINYVEVKKVDGSDKIMTTQIVSDYLDEKMEIDEEYIVCTFFDLRVKHNIQEKDVQKFLELAKIKLENLDYKVYFTGAEFLFKGDRKRVKENEYMIAIKDNDKVKVNY